MEQKTCHIVAAAPVRFEVPQIAEGDLLIAADGGFAKCLEAGLEPNLVIGDFDSFEGALPQDLATPVIELPCAKDDTDLLAAIRIGLARGYRSFALRARWRPRPHGGGHPQPRLAARARLRGLRCWCGSACDYRRPR